MAVTTRRWFGIVLWVTAFLCTICSMNFSFQAGCAGDAKGGSFGDIHAALDLEGLAVALSWLGIALALIAVAAREALAVQQRIGAAIAVLLVGVIGLTILGIQFETWGVQHCLAQK